MIHVVSSTTLQLTWTAPSPELQNGIIVGYSSHIMQVGDNETLEFNTTLTTLMITSLSPYTHYTWRVAARTAIGIGPFSAPVTQRTLPDGKN